MGYAKTFGIAHKKKLIVFGLFNKKVNFVSTFFIKSIDIIHTRLYNKDAEVDAHKTNLALIVVCEKEKQQVATNSEERRQYA